MIATAALAIEKASSQGRNECAIVVQMASSHSTRGGRPSDGQPHASRCTGVVAHTVVAALVLGLVHHKSAPVTGRRRAECTAGRRSGAPNGSRNGNYRHGRYTKEVAVTRRWIQEARELLRKLK
jgi:hypothetical protein